MNSRLAICTYFNLTREARCWVEKTFDGLSLGAKIAQLLHPTLVNGSQSVEHCRPAMGKYQFGGGFIAGPYKELRKAVATLLSDSAVPPLFSSDFECGARLVREGTCFGAAMSLGAIADLSEAIHYAYEAGKVTALQGTAAGVHWSFAPVVDVNFNPDNPITNIRSFGDDPERVAALSGAYLRGMQDHGMAAAIKHFPGDGVDSRDQHIGTTVNTLPFDEWERTYGRTFSAGIAAGTYAVMIGHIALVGVSTRDQYGRYLPATMDRAIQMGLLRKKLGFQGVIISDAMPMGGSRARCRTEVESIVQNIATGSDVALMPTDPAAAFEALCEAVERGIITGEHLDDAVWRILSLKAKLRLYEPQIALPPAETAERQFRAEKYEPLAREIAEKSITLVRDYKGDYPLSLSPGGKIVLCHLPRDVYEGGLKVATEVNHETPPQTPLHRSLAHRGFRVVDVSNVVDLKKELEDAGALVYVSNTVCQAGRGSIRLTKGAFSLIDWDVITSDLPVFFVAFGTPYAAWELADFPNFVCAYFSTPVIEETYASLLLGELPFLGKLPVRLPASA
jgi:beta-N-acetylhexosaminidase